MKDSDEFMGLFFFVDVCRKFDLTICEKIDLVFKLSHFFCVNHQDD